MPRTYKRKREKTWNEENMSAAIAAVENGELNQYKAAKLHNIPRQTLHDRLNKHLSEGTKAGRPPRLSRDEECEIVETCLIILN